MSSVIKINACVYSRIGYGRTENTNSFYMNGKFTSERHIENIQASMENRGAEYLFAVSDNMIWENSEQDINVSILKEIGRLHEKVTVNGGDIGCKAKEIESRVNDTERLLSSFLEMNKVPMTDPRWNLGFSALLLSEGQFVALTGGNGRIYMMRDERFKPLASETARAKRSIDAKLFATDEEESVEIELPGDENTGSAIVSDISDLHEGDSFILISDGLHEALGEEKVEDLLALKSDSAYIAHRLVDEAMKRNTNGDITALVVQIERISEGSPTVRKTANRQQPQQPKQNIKSKVDKFNKTPAVTYKYNKQNRRASKYQSTVFALLVILTVIVLFGFIYLIINSLMNTGKNSGIVTPTPTITASASPTHEPSETADPSETPTPTPTPEPTIIEHVVASGDSINSITKKYYGDALLVSKLCDYNNISDPNKITIGQVIKIPPKESLTSQ